MKIAIDVSQIVYGTGVSVYTKNLVENLLRLDKTNEYILYGGALRRRGQLKSILADFKGGYQSKMLPIAPYFADIIWNKLHIMPIERLLGKIDIFHSSDWSQPPSKAVKITTIHDMVPIKYPKLSQAKLISNQTSRFKWIKKEVDKVIVPTNSTADDVEKMGISHDKIKVIPEAVDSAFKPAKEISIKSIKRKYRISGKYILSVGVNPRKNTQRIIDAYEMVKSEVDLKLVIIGHPFLKETDTRGVRFLGHVPSQDLVSLYSGAEVLVYPSLYEGFGLPILEAYACKLPVVTSDFGSMAEVAGNAAVLVDPYSSNSIKEGIYKAIKNRSKLIKYGSNRLKNFSWQITARETLKLYTESLK